MSCGDNIWQYVPFVVASMNGSMKLILIHSGTGALE
jgi:hypothetical protein